MNEKIKKKWVEALKSGDYKQDFHQLKSPQSQGFCCLGVLCDLYCNETGKGKWHGSIFVTDTHSSDVSLTPDVKKWAELNNACIEGKSLSSINDEGFTFKEIAEKIQEKL